MRREDMPSPAILTQLLAQAEGEGADLITLRAMVEEASELGAQRVLGAAGPVVVAVGHRGPVVCSRERFHHLW